MWPRSADGVALYAFAPEALAHAGIAGVDVATGLGITVSVYAFRRFLGTTCWRDPAVLALATGGTERHPEGHQTGPFVPFLPHR